MVSIVVFISFIVASAPEFLFGSFLGFLSLCWTSHFVHVLFSWFHWIVFLCFPLAHWVSLKPVFQIIYWVHCRSPYWDWLLKDYCDLCCTFLEVLYCCLFILTISHLLQFLVTTFFNGSKLVFFPPAVCWNFFAGYLDFYKDSLTRKWLSKTVLSRSSWLRQAGVDSWATARSTVGTKVCMPIAQCNMWVRLFPGPLAYGTRSHSSQESTFVYWWKQNYCCWGWVGTQTRDIFFSHNAPYTLTVVYHILSYASRIPLIILETIPHQYIDIELILKN